MTEKWYITEPLSIAVNCDDCVDTVADAVSLKPSDIKRCVLHRRSIDARHKDYIVYNCTFRILTAETPSNAKLYTAPVDWFKDVQPSENKKVVVVGSGPAGLFCARYLAAAGVDVTVVERGGDIKSRVEAVTSFNKGGPLDCDNNIQFGLGGAGTFSDGKLTTGITSPYVYTVFNEFYKQGAEQDILTSNLPHIGTDYLVRVVDNIKNTVVKDGGKFLFHTRFTDVVIKDGKVTEVVLQQQGRQFCIPCDYLVLAIGHSARDTFEMLYAEGFEMISKPFAVGVRIEHDRRFISRQQYGRLALTHRDFASASYKLTANFPDRSCYSFCMCPGGEVVCASSELNSVVVNGMSNYDRLAPNSNSALVVNVDSRDFGEGVLDGVKFQRRLERLCYDLTLSQGAYKAPAQNVTDFLKGVTTTKFDLQPSYARGVVSVNLRKKLPDFISETIAKALPLFGRKIKGFDKCGVLTAVESRTSSPVRILRDKDMFATTYRNVIPCGEGCGYSGGIVSSAVEGIKAALALTGRLEPPLKSKNIPQ